MRGKQNMKKNAGYIAAGVTLMIVLTMGSMCDKEYQKQQQVQKQ